MSPTLFVELLLSGLGVGAVYSLVAIGYNVIFATTGVLNFAQGEYFMLGTMLGVFFYVSLGLPVVLALVATVLVLSVIGALEEPLAVRPAAKSGEGAFGWVISTFGFSIVMVALTALMMGARIRPFPPILDLGRHDIGGVVVDGYRMFIVAVALVVGLAMHLFLQHTPTGQALGAIHQDRDAALLRGIPVTAMAVLAFAIGGGVVGLVGFLVAPLITASASVGLMFGLKGFIAAALGGIPSIKGAVLGGLLLGPVEVFGAHFAGGGFRNATVFAVLILVLAIRPAGIFGRESVRAV